MEQAPLPGYRGGYGFTITRQRKTPIILPGSFTLPRLAEHGNNRAWIESPDDRHAPDEDRRRCAYCGFLWSSHPRDADEARFIRHKNPGGHA